MKTKTKLDAVFEEAFPVPFDEKSKFVFFSDIHRGDDSLSDEFGRNRHIYSHALDYYYQNDYTYIEVGDGDELWEHKKYSTICTAHASVFQKLKLFYDKGRMLMLFGNHNIQLSNPDYVSENLYSYYNVYGQTKVELFPDIVPHEALILTHRKTGQKIFVVHGHQGDFMNDQMWWLSHIFIRYGWRFMHNVGIKYAARPATSRAKRHRIEKNYDKWIRINKTMLICGHTHRAKFPADNELPYFNTGCCMHPRGITCIEITNDMISLVAWNMASNLDGMLYIKRTVLRGPEPILKFDEKTQIKET